MTRTTGSASRPGCSESAAPPTVPADPQESAWRRSSTSSCLMARCDRCQRLVPSTQIRLKGGNALQGKRGARPLHRINATGERVAATWAPSRQERSQRPPVAPRACRGPHRRAGAALESNRSPPDVPRSRTVSAVRLLTYPYSSTYQASSTSGASAITLRASRASTASTVDAHERLAAGLLAADLHRRDVDVVSPMIVPTLPITPGRSRRGRTPCSCSAPCPGRSRTATRCAAGPSCRGAPQPISTGPCGVTARRTSIET